MKRTSYLNGNYIEHDKAMVHVEDRGYVFSDGVYEVALIINNTLIDWPLHYKRLQNSLKGLKIAYKASESELKNITLELMKKNELESGVLYLQVTRGVARRDHQFPTPPVPASIYMSVSKGSFPSDEQYANGVKVVAMPDLRWKRRDYKTISLLPNILAKQEAVEKGAAEAILVEDDGYVTEGSSSNFFIVDGDGVLRTHPLNERILGGITRDGILQVARDNKIKTSEKMFTIDEALAASEAFISSTTKHILPVSNINGQKIGGGKAGEITKKLMELYKEYINRQVK